MKARILLEKSNGNASYLLGDLNDYFYNALVLSSQMIEYTGVKGLIAYQIQEMYENNEVNEKNILSLIRDIKKLSLWFEKIRISFTSMWLKESQEKGMDGTLYLFSKASTALADCVIFLAKERDIILNGGEADLSRYQGEYKTLWTSDFKNMWDRAYPWQ